jgi:hypothetical protein
MSKNTIGFTQGIINAFWKAAQSLRGRPAPPACVKLDGRRGYGDGNIPAPDRHHDDTSS